MGDSARAGGGAVTVGSPSSAYDVIYVGFLLGHGGDALQMLTLAAGARARGARVKIIVPHGPHSVTFQQRCDALGLECERSPLITADMYHSRQDLRALLRLFRSLDATVVHFHTGNSCLPRTAMVALRLLRFRRTFVTIQSPYETIDARSLRGRFWALTGRCSFHAVVSPSHHASRFQRSCGMRESIVVTVPNAVDTVAMGSGDGTAPRAVLGIGPDTPLVVFCSRIDKQKRPLEAVAIFAAVAADHPDALLVFVGGGELEAHVTAEAERLGVGGRVRLVGYQTNVPDWLAAATVWLLPTERENFSVAVLEALAAGCAVVSTTCRGNDEVLVDGQNALTFPVGDVAAAARAVDRLLGDPALRQALGAAGRETVTAYTADQMVERYFAVYAREAATPAVLRPAAVTSGAAR